MTSDFDVLVVGAGLTGSVVSRMLADSGFSVKILESRDHLGGNVYDYDDSGVLIHKYGPHIFHTSDERTFKFISRFSQWIPYKLDYRTNLNGRFLKMPFDFSTIDALLPSSEALELKAEFCKLFPDKKSVSVLDLLKSSSRISKFIQMLVDSEYKPYTASQWGKTLDEVGESVLSRVPFYLGYGADYYKNDLWQCLPKYGFTKFIEEMLCHPLIQVKLNADGMAEANELLKDRIKPVVYTGRIDQLFKFKYGKLPYRSLRFEYRKEPVRVQLYPVVANPDPATNRTRITNYSLMPAKNVDFDLLGVEYSQEYDDAINIPFYPILNASSEQILAKYRIDAAEYDNLFLCGRLGAFKYINMDEAVEQAMMVAQNIIKNKM